MTDIVDAFSRIRMSDTSGILENAAHSDNSPSRDIATGEVDVQCVVRQTTRYSKYVSGYYPYYNQLKE